MRFMLCILLCISISMSITSCYFYDINFMQFYNTEKCIRRTGFEPYYRQEDIDKYIKRIYECCKNNSYKELECEYIAWVSSIAIKEYLNYNY